MKKQRFLLSLLIVLTFTLAISAQAPAPVPKPEAQMVTMRDGVRQGKRIINSGINRFEV